MEKAWYWFKESDVQTKIHCVTRSKGNKMLMLLCVHLMCKLAANMLYIFKKWSMQTACCISLKWLKIYICWLKLHLDHNQLSWFYVPKWAKVCCNIYFKSFWYISLLCSLHAFNIWNKIHYKCYFYFIQVSTFHCTSGVLINLTRLCVQTVFCSFYLTFCSAVFEK